MSVTYQQLPTEFQPVLSDGIFMTVTSSTYNVLTTYKFKYLYNLFVDGVLVFEGKCSPNPYGVGIIDLQQVLETYTDSLPVSYWNTTPIYTHQTVGFSRPANVETINYEVRCGYEYSDSPLGQITGFTGIGSGVGLPSQSSGSFKVFRSTMGTNGRATQQSFDIDPYVLSGTPVGQYPTTSGLFLTNAPRIMDVQSSDFYTLGFTNYYLWSGGTSMGLSEPYYVLYNFYDDQGTLITGYTMENITTNGGGPRTNCNDVYQQLYLIDPITGTTEFNTLYVGAGPQNLPVLPNNTRQYTVQLYGKFTGSTTPYPVTPTPTPTPSSTGLPPRPTPTPTSTPPCPDCDTFDLTYTGDGSQTTVTIVNCDNGLSQNVVLLAGLTYRVCSCGEPFTGGDVDIVNFGPCPLSPTPTPSATPGCVCEEYSVENLNPYSAVIQYLKCDGDSLTLVLPPFDNTQICACQGSIVADPNVNIQLLGPCSITPTPTPSVTPTSSPPPVTPSPTTSGYAYYYLAENCDVPGDTRCFASNSVFVPGKVIKGLVLPECYEILDFCSAPQDDVVINSYDDCPSCPR